MRKLILKMSVSVDGFVGGEKGESDWIFKTMDEGAIGWTMKSIWQAGLHLMGARTFHDMASYWPSSKEVYAEPMNQIPKAVFSKNRDITNPETWSATQTQADARAASGTKGTRASAEKEKSWIEARVMPGDLAQGIAQLKSEPGRDIMAHGGAGFARSLVRLGLVDEYQLLVHPVTLGKGLPIFSDLPKPLALRLVSAAVFPGGAIGETYVPA